MSTMILLLALILIVIGALIYQKWSVVQEKREGFTTQSDTQIAFCPINTNAYLNSNGDTECCDGPVAMNECMGTPICAIATNSALPSCSEVQNAYTTTMGDEVCPSGLKYYEPTSPTEMSGCADVLNSKKDGPHANSVKKCTIYNDRYSNYKLADSCYNQKHLVDVSNSILDIFSTGYIKSELSPHSLDSNNPSSAKSMQMVDVTYQQNSINAICNSAQDLALKIDLQQEYGFLTQPVATKQINLINSGRYAGECSAAAAAYSLKTIAPSLLETTLPTS